MLRHIDPFLGIMKNARFYNWMFTVFDKDNQFINWKLPDTKIKFAVWQKEEAPTTKTLHIQGYIELTEKVSMKWLKENMSNDELHLEPRKGTQKQAIDYCTKEETRVEGEKPKFYGIQKSQGNRSDLDSIVDAIENGSTGKEILLMFRGNALRHMNMITHGLRVMHNMDAIDNEILWNRQVNDLKLEENA